MKHIKKFESKEEDIYREEFEFGKRETLIKIDELLEVFVDFMDDISPKHWRTTGHYYKEIKNLKEEIQKLTPITKTESEIDWVKEQRFKR